MTKPPLPAPLLHMLVEEREEAEAAQKVRCAPGRSLLKFEVWGDFENFAPWLTTQTHG
jgi:hypothetical protein